MYGISIESLKIDGLKLILIKSQKIYKLKKQ